MESTVETGEKDAAAAIRLDAENLVRRALEAAAAGVRNALFEYFLARQREPRRDGFTPAGFWYSNNGASVAERVRAPDLADGSARIAIDSAPLAHKLKGGEVTPKGGRKYLAFPATDAASRFPGLPRDNPALRPKPFGHAPSPLGGDRPALLDASGKPLYWLIRKALHRSDPRALPDTPTLAASALRAISNLDKTSHSS